MRSGAVPDANPPLMPQSSVADRLKASGIVVLTGVAGIGMALALRSVWKPEAETSISPVSEAANPAREPASLRDRIPVVPAETAPISAPETVPALPLRAPTPRTTRQPRSTPPPLTVSHGFGQGTAPTTTSPASPASPEKSSPSPAPTSPETLGGSKAAANLIATLLQPPTPARAVASRPSDFTDPAQTLPSFEPKRPTATAIRPPLLSPPRPPVGINPPDRPPGAPGAQLAPPPRPGTPAPASPGALPAPPAAAPGESPPAAPPAAVAATSPVTAAVRIVRQPITITGGTRFSPQDLAEILRKAIPDQPDITIDRNNTLITRQLTPAELVQISEAITEKYTGSGYINSGAYVPSDVLTGAPPEIRIVEGGLESINVTVASPGFRGLAQPLSPDYIRQRLATAVQMPLQIDQLVDAVKVLEQNPLIGTISTQLLPGTTTGRSILEVKVTEAPPLRTTLAVNNGRSPSVGALEQQLGIDQANLLGLGDRLQLNYRRTEGSDAWSAGYSIPFNARNGTLSFNYTSTSGRVIEEPFRDLDIKSRSESFELALRQPLIQTSTEELAFTLRGTTYSSQGLFLESLNAGVPVPFPSRGSDVNGATRVTALRFGQEWSTRSERDVISLQSEFAWGLDALGATVLTTAPDGRFFSWQGRGLWVHALAPDTLLALRSRIQLSAAPLVPSEQISLGGLDTIRGYRSNVLTTDNGWFASLEAYLPILRIPEWNGLLQIVPFFDIGQGWNQGEDQPNPSQLMSTGLGLQWKMGENLRVRLDWGIPLVNASVSGGRSLEQNLYFSVIFSP